MVTTDGIRRRIERPERLSGAIARSIQNWRKGDDPLLHLERRALVYALSDLLAGCEAARLALTRAHARLRQPHVPQAGDPVGVPVSREPPTPSPAAGEGIPRPRGA